MIVLKWVFPVSLAALAIVHLISCWRGDDDLRKPTKVALMPVVALTYLAFARMPSLWVVAGLLFGCLGDLFLLWPLKNKFFVLGTTSFFLGHVCYLIFIYTHYVIRVSWIWIVVVCAIYAAGAVVVYSGSHKHIPRALRPLSLAYMLMLCVLSVSLILPLLTAFWWGKLVRFSAQRSSSRPTGCCVICSSLRRRSRARRISSSCSRTSSRRCCWPSVLRPARNDRKTAWFQRKRGSPVWRVPFVVQ